MEKHVHFFAAFWKKLFKKIRFRLKLIRLDSLWYASGGSSYMLFPPSFYYTHNEKEITELTEQELDTLREILLEYKKKNGL